MVTQNDTAQPLRTQLGRMGFNGELLECITGHYMLGNGYRAYSPLLMIFIQPDSWSPFGAGGLNAYAYCKGDPVNAADPTGHMPFRRLFQFNRGTRSPSSGPYNIPSSLPVLSGSEVAQVLAGLTPDPVPGSPAGRVSPGPAWPPERFSPVHILAETAPVVSQPSAVLPASAGSVGSSGVVLASNHKTVNYPYIKTEISRMVFSNDAEGIIALANKRFVNIPVLRELHRQLPLTPAERTAAFSRRGQSPSISQHHLGVLEVRAQREGLPEKAEFYRQLRRGFAEKNRRRSRTR